MLKPLSAMQSSLGSNLSMRPDFIVMCLSETPPGHSFETNVKAPVGEITTRSLKVFELLLLLQVTFCADGPVRI